MSAEMSSISFITRSVSGPIAPTPCIAIGREAGGMQDFEPCMLLEQIASALTKSGKPMASWNASRALPSCSAAHARRPSVSTSDSLNLAEQLRSLARGCLTKVADSKIGLATAAVCT